MEFLNDFHRQQHELSKTLVAERSKAPPVSQRKFLDQVRRLSKQSPDAKAERKQRSEDGLPMKG
jgi:hypothetical protein